MRLLVEETPRQRLLRCWEVPGAVVCGQHGAPLIWQLQQELARFRVCFPWMSVKEDPVGIVAERCCTERAAGQKTSATVFSLELEYTPEQLVDFCRLLLESCALLRRCHASFPDPSCDYMEGEPHDEEQVGSGDEALLWFLQRFVKALQLWRLQTVNVPSSAEALLREDGWYRFFEAALNELRQRQDFMGNGLFHTPDGFCCTGAWLRGRIEECHLAGRRMYTLGVSCVGRRLIADSFHFETELTR